MVTVRKSSQIPKKNICNLFLKGHVINVHPCLLNNCFLCFVNHKYHISLTTVSQEQECFQMLVICILIKDYRVNFGKFYLDYVWTYYMLINKSEWLFILKKINHNNNSLRKIITRWDQQMKGKNHLIKLNTHSS